MVTHGQATDPFWSVVSNGAKDAAKDLGISFHYQSPQSFDMVTMSQMIDAVVATEPDGLILSVPDIPALRKSIISASKKNIPIIVINSGSEIMKEVDILYPNYGFQHHKGYPTKIHLEALKSYGITKEHRLTFKPVRDIYDGN